MKYGLAIAIACFALGFLLAAYASEPSSDLGGLGILALLLLGITLTVVGVWRFSARPKMTVRQWRLQRRQIEERTEMSEDEFVSAYYAGSGIVRGAIHEVLTEVARDTHMPAGKLRPSDRFDEALGPQPFWGWGDEIVELDWYLKDKMRKARCREAVEVYSLDDLIRRIHELETGRAIRQRGKE